MEAIASRLEAIATSNKKLLVARCIVCLYTIDSAPFQSTGAERTSHPLQALPSGHGFTRGGKSDACTASSLCCTCLSSFRAPPNGIWAGMFSRITSLLEAELFCPVMSLQAGTLKP